jgi:hypothetical protein
MGSIYTSKRKRVGLQLYTATRTNVETSGDSHSNAQQYNGTGSGFTNLLRVVSMSLSSIIPGYGPRVLTHNFAYSALGRVGLQLYTATRTNVETSGDSHSNAQQYNGTGSGFTNLLRVVSMSLSSIIPGYGPRVLTHNFAYSALGRRLKSRQRTADTEEKEKRENGEITELENPYSRNKAKKGCKTGDKDVQRKETSNSIRTVLERWMGARKPKFKESRHGTGDTAQGNGKEWKQGGIGQFFKRRAEDIP